MTLRITLRQLEYCLAASDRCSVIDAAEQVSVSPSSISAAISHLEEELGVQLFVRHHAQGLSVTPVGRRVLSEMRHVVDHVAGLQSVAVDVLNSTSGPLRVGCFSSLAAMIMPELCLGFVREHPSVQLTTVEDHQEGLLDRIKYGEIDMAITYDLQLDEEHTEFLALSCLPAHVIVGESHALAKRSAVHLGELCVLPMVLLDIPLSRDYFLSLFHAQDLSPQISHRTKSQDMVRALVANEAGYAIANARPRVSMALDGRGIVQIPLVGEHRPLRVGLVSSRCRQVSKVVELFRQHCKTCISDEYIPGMQPPAAALAPGHSILRQAGSEKGNRNDLS